MYEYIQIYTSFSHTHTPTHTHTYLYGPIIWFTHSSFSQLPKVQVGKGAAIIAFQVILDKFNAFA